MGGRKWKTETRFPDLTVKFYTFATIFYMNWLYNALSSCYLRNSEYEEQLPTFLTLNSVVYLANGQLKTEPYLLRPKHFLSMIITPLCV